jgi:hypothetical protein
MEDVDIQQGLDRLTWRVDSHAERLANLHEQTSGLKADLNCINKSLLQIKWIAVGASVVIMGQSIGASHILKLLGV